MSARKDRSSAVMRVTLVVFGTCVCVMTVVRSQEIVGDTLTPVELVNQLCVAHDQRELAAGQPQADILRQLRIQRIMGQLIESGTNCWPAIPALVAAMSYPDYRVVTAVAEVLSGIHAERSPDWRSAQNSFRDSITALHAFQWLAFGGGANGFFPSDVPRVRFGLEGLAAVGPLAKPLAPALELLIRSRQDHELWRAASLALDAVGFDATELGPDLKLTLSNHDEHPYVRASAAEALSILCKDPETRTLLRKMLHDGSSHVQLAAARGLWTLKEPADSVLPTFTTLLQHKLASVRLGALLGLLEMGPAAGASRSWILELENDGDERVRQAAAEVIGKMNVSFKNEP